MQPAIKIGSLYSPANKINARIQKTALLSLISRHNELNPEIAYHVYTLDGYICEMLDLASSYKAVLSSGLTDCHYCSFSYSANTPMDLFHLWYILHLPAVFMRPSAVFTKADQLCLYCTVAVLQVCTPEGLQHMQGR